MSAAFDKRNAENCPEWRNICPLCGKHNILTQSLSNSPKLTSQTKHCHATVNAFRDHGLKKGLSINILVGRQPCQFQLDSGASVNISSGSYMDCDSIRRPTTTLKVWCERETDILGEVTLKVQNTKITHGEKTNSLANERNIKPILGLDAIQ